MDQPVEMTNFSDEIKTKAIGFLKNPVYMALTFLFIISGGASAYILLFSANTPPTASTNTSSQAQTALIALSPIPSLTPLSSPSATPIVSISATPTPGSDPTVSWNLFSDPSYGYSIRYPTDWSALNTGQLEPLVPNYSVFNPISGSASAQAITISYTIRSSDQLKAIYDSNGGRITINNLTGTIYNQQDSDGNKTVSIVVPLTVNELVFFAQQQYQTILMQMLGTFKITN